MSKKLMASLLFVIACLCSFAADAFTSSGFTMRITVNGLTNSATLHSNENVSVKVSLSCGSYAGVAADWWVLAGKASEYYYLNSSGQWIGPADLACVRPVYQGALFDLAPVEIYRGAGLPAGNYVLYFGLDARNGTLDPDVVYTTGALQIIPPAKWTLMYYLDGDNNLEPDFLTKFTQLAQGGSDSNISIVAQFDRAGNSTNFGYWSGCERFYVTNGMTPVRECAVADWDDGIGGRAVNMGEPSTLTSFINWAAYHYPAERYALMLGDHGFGWRGLCIDSSSDDDYMFITELKNALTNASIAVDLVVMDACLMQMVETLHELALAGVDYAIGSETYGQTDWPYRAMLDGLFQHPEWTARDAAVDMHARLASYFSTRESITLSLADLSQAPLLVSNVSALAGGMVNTSLTFAAVQAQAAALMAQINRTIISEYHGADWNGKAYGMTIYFPQPVIGYLVHAPESFDFYIPSLTTFAADGLWHYFLSFRYNQAPDQEHQIKGEIVGIHSGMLGEYFETGQECLDLYDFCSRIVNYQPALSPATGGEQVGKAQGLPQMSGGKSMAGAGF